MIESFQKMETEVDLDDEDLIEELCLDGGICTSAHHDELQKKYKINYSTKDQNVQSLKPSPYSPTKPITYHPHYQLLALCYVDFSYKNKDILINKKNVKNLRSLKMATDLSVQTKQSQVLARMLCGSSNLGEDEQVG